jgi:ribosomal-protein-alanine N-acetyltransferase
MSEVLPEVIRYGFTTMKLHRIEAMVGPNNGASLRLMQKFGFRHEGHLKAHYLRNGIYEDSVVFGLLRSEWDSGLEFRTN